MRTHRASEDQCMQRRKELHLLGLRVKLLLFPCKFSASMRHLHISQEWCRAGSSTRSCTGKQQGGHQPASGGGAAIGLSDKEGRTPLHAAAHTVSADAVRLFIAAGANSNAACHHGHTPLHDCIWGAGEADPAILGHMYTLCHRRRRPARNLSGQKSLQLHRTSLCTVPNCKYMQQQNSARRGTAHACQEGPCNCLVLACHTMRHAMTDRTFSKVRISICTQQSLVGALRQHLRAL
jgi:hypothetical protein